jgi:large conductance mechanosensitive channel
VLKGFKEFIMRGNVVDLAIAVVVGTAFTAFVKALVADILTPFIAAIAGKPNFAALHFTLHHSTFFYGDLVNAAITFLSVAFAIYLFVVFPMNTLAERRARGQVTVDELPPDIALLTEIRDLLAGTNDASTSA